MCLCIRMHMDSLVSHHRGMLSTPLLSPSLGHSFPPVKVSPRCARTPGRAAGVPVPGGCVCCCERGGDCSGGEPKRVAARELGLDVVEVPENEYAIVRLEGPVPECIHRGWRYVMESFLPEHGYRHSGAPDFEAYAPGDIRAVDYEMELWVPIEKM